MSLSLYRKYRPSHFSEVTGQDPIVETILHQSEKRQFAHAYLFTGPRGVGKTTMARLVAKAANCKKNKKDGEPDNSCDHCIMIQAGKAIDIMEIDAASHTGVDHVRSVIIESSRTAPSILPYKVFIIDEVHMLSGSAFNALLKTLEEPPAHAIFILATTEVQKVPETILSRCQRFSFHRIGIKELIERLAWVASQEKVKVDVEVLQEIATRSEGSSRDAESLLGQLLVFGEKHITKKIAAVVLPHSSASDVSKLIGFIVEGDQEGALNFIQQFIDDGGSAEQFMNDSIRYIRSQLLVATNSKRLKEFASLQYPAEIFSTLLKQSVGLGETALLRMLETFIRVKKTFTYADIPQMPIEIAVYETLLGKNSNGEKLVAPAQTVQVKQKIQTQGEHRTETSSQSTLKIMQKPKAQGALISLSLLKDKWQEFTNQVREVNRALSMSMQVSTPLTIEGNTIILAVPYAFHQERLQLPQHREIIEQRVSEYFQTPLIITTSLQQGTSNQVSKANVVPVKENLWDQVIDAFGEQLAPSQD